MARTYTWKAGVSGNWVKSHDWSIAGSPGASATAVIDQPGTYGVTIDAAQSIAVAALTLDAAAAQLDVFGTLQATHGIADENGAIVLEGAGTFAAGTTIALSGGAALVSDSSRTLDSVRVVLGGTIGAGEYPLEPAEIYSVGTLTFGSEAVLEITAGNGDGLYGGYVTSGPTFGISGSVINDGTVLIDASATPQVQLFLLDNAGLLNIGADATIDPGEIGDFVNSGTLKLGAGAKLDIFGQYEYIVATKSSELVGTFSNTGHIMLGTGAVLEIDVALAGGALANIVSSGGTVLVTNTLDNAGNTLNFSTDPSLGTLRLGTTGYTGAPYGVLIGGTLVAGAAEAAFATSLGTIEDVTQLGALIADGLSFGGGLALLGAGGTGPGSLDAIAFTAIDNETLDNARLTIGDLGNDQGLTLGAHLTVALNAGAEIESRVATGSLTNDTSLAIAAATTIAEAAFANDGHISIGNGGTLQFVQATVAGLTIQTLGSLTVDAGGVLWLGTTFAGLPYVTVTTAGLVGLHVAAGGTFLNSGMIDNTGATLNVTPASFLNNMAGGGYITGGTIVLNGGSFETRGLSDLTFRAGPTGMFDLDNETTTGVTLLGHNAAGGTFEVASQSDTELYPELQMSNDTVGNVTVFASTGIDDSFTPEYDLRGVDLFQSGAEFTGIGDFYAESGATVTNQGTIESGTTIGGSFTIEGPGSFTNTGLIEGSCGILAANFVNDGTIVATGTAGDIGIATISGTGLLMVSGGGFLGLPDAVAATQTVDFGAGGLLVLGEGASQPDFGGFDATLKNFKLGGTIELFGWTETSFSVAAGTLTVKDGSTTVFSHDFGAGYVKADFSVSNDVNRIVIAGTT